MISLGLKLAVSTALKPITVISPEAAYIAALTAAGASVTAPQQAAISTFMSGEIAAGRWDGIKRLYFPVWGSAAANAICMKSLTSSTFYGGVTHGAGYIQGDEITGYVNTNTTPSSIGLTKDSYYAGCLCIQRQGSDHVDFGLTGFTGGAPFGNFYFINDFYFNESTEEYYFNNGLMQISDQNVFHYSPISTLCSVSGTTSSRFIKDRNSSGVTTRSTTVTTNTRELNDISLYLMNANQGNAPTSWGWSSSKYGAFFFGTALSDSQDTAYTLALKTLWETCTGLTLPTI